MVQKQKESLFMQKQTLDSIEKDSINREDFVVRARRAGHTLQSIADHLGGLTRERVRQIQRTTEKRMLKGEDISIRPSVKKIDHNDEVFMRKIKLTPKMVNFINELQVSQAFNNGRIYKNRYKDVSKLYKDTTVKMLENGLAKRSVFGSDKNNNLNFTLTSDGVRVLKCLRDGITGIKVINEDNEEKVKKG